MATITKLSSGTWRVQIRRKGKYANQTFRRRGDAEQWARAMESRIDRGEPILSREKETKTFAGLIGLHLGDLAEVGKPLGRSKRASMEFLKARLGQFRPAELDRERLITFGKERAKEGAGPVTVGIDLGYIKTVLSHAAAVRRPGSTGSIGSTARMEENQKTVRGTVFLSNGHDQFANGQRFRVLNVVDGVTRECLAAIPPGHLDLRASCGA